MLGEYAQLRQMAMVAKFRKNVNAPGGLKLAEKGITKVELATAQPQP